MKIIIPMAGRGSRLRPHTLTTPKPLLPVAGKAIVRRIVEDLANGMDEKVEEVAVLPEPVGVVGIVHGAFVVAHQQDEAGVELRLQAVPAFYVGIFVEHVLVIVLGIEREI